MKYFDAFHSVEEASEYFHKVAGEGTSVAIHLSPNPTPPLLDAYVTHPQLLTHFQTPREFGWREQLAEALLTADVVEQVRRYCRQSFKPANSMNGKAIDTRVFPTQVAGVSLQVIFVEEWWQAMGGAHVGDTTDIWLINHAPLEAAA